MPRNPLAGIIPTDAIPDPALLLDKAKAQVTGLGINPNIGNELLSDINARISTLTNTVPTTVDGNFELITKRLKSAGVTFNPIPNVLDKFASYTYKIKMSMTSDQRAQNVHSHADWKQVPKEVIAESGVTAGFNIRNFELKNYCSPQQRIGIALHTSWSMTLVEPYGFSLIDRMFTVANKMGVADHIKCVYFIEIWLQGNDDAGVPSDAGVYKLFKVIIENISVDSTSSGSIYNIQGLVLGSLAQANEFAMAPNIMHIPEVETLGAFWAEFQSRLNEQAQKLDAGNVSTRIEYEFVIPEKWKAWKFSRSLDDTARQSGFEAKGNPTKPAITVSKGMDYSKLMQTLMSMTTEGKNFTLGPNSNGKDAAAGGTKAYSEGQALIPKLESKTEFIGYNYYYNDYVKKCTYYFSPYPTTRSYMDKKFIDRSATPEVQKARLQSFISDARLTKVYYYQFTGMNTDILKFDLHLDNYWTALIPIYDGYNTTEGNDLGPKVNPQSYPEIARNQYNLAKTQFDAAKATLAKIEKLDDASKKDPNYKVRLQLAQNDVRQAQERLDVYKNINVTDYEILFSNGSPGEQSIGGIVVKNKALYENAKIRADIAARAAYNLTRTAAKDRYLESITPENPKFTPLPVTTFISNSPNTQNNSNAGEQTTDPVSNDSSSQPKTRGLLATALENVLSPQFVQIDITIRGDPYWVGLDNVEGEKYLPPDTKPDPKSVGYKSALFGQGECAFLLFFRTGEEPNEETGLVDFNTVSWAFNGLYVAIEVDNHFKDGAFTQTIKAIKDTTMWSIFNNVPVSAAAENLAAGKAPP